MCSIREHHTNISSFGDHRESAGNLESGQSGSSMRGTMQFPGNIKGGLNTAETPMWNGSLQKP